MPTDFIANLDLPQWLSLAFAAFMAGLTKAGVDGGTLLAIPILAVLFGARASSSLMLGLLITADSVALWNYRKQGKLSLLVKTLPFALAGIMLGALAGSRIPDAVFRRVMATFILTSVSLMAIREARGASFVLPERWWLAAPLGLLAGFVSMVGNAAGPVMGLFLLSSGLPKSGIVGTTAWFFCLVNLAKLPFHILVWKTAGGGSLLVGLLLAPITVASTLAGIRFIRWIPEKPFRLLRMIAAGTGGVYLLVR